MTDQLPAERVVPRKTGWPPLPPTIPSGRAVMGGQCPHTAPDSCYWCDGRAEDDRELRRVASRQVNTQRGTT